MSAPKFARGDIVRCDAMHADGSGESKHPCLIVGDAIDNTNQDYILIHITSRTHIGRTDFVLEESDKEFPASGLDHKSTFRCHKIFPMAPSRVQHRYGIAGPNLMRKVEKRLKIALSLT